MTPDQISQYKEAGYTIVPGFFAAAEVRALRREVQRWVATGLPRDVSIPQRKRNLQLIPLWPHSRLFRAVPFHPKVVSAVSTLLGDPVVKILDQMFYKPPGDGTGTNWHTDNAYFRIPDLDHAGEAMRNGHRWQHVHLTGEQASGGEREYGEPVSFQSELAQAGG